MKRRFLIYLVALFACIACNTINNHPADNDTVKAKIIHADGLPGENVVPPVFVINDSLIKMDFVNAEKGTITSVNGVMNEKFTVCEVTIDKADSLFAQVLPQDGAANFHFDHVSYPERQNEGPFGNILRIGIFQPGIYRLFILQDQSTKINSGQKFKLMVWLK